MSERKLRKKSVQARKSKYALVLYNKDKQRGVVAFETLVTRSKTANKGGMCSAPDPVDWDKTSDKRHSAIIVEFGDDIDYLYSLDVSPTGQILKDCRNEELLVKKKTLQVLTEAQKKNRLEEKEKLNHFVQELPCLFARNNNANNLPTPPTENQSIPEHQESLINNSKGSQQATTTASAGATLSNSTARSEPIQIQAIVSDSIAEENQQVHLESQINNHQTVTVTSNATAHSEPIHIQTILTDSIAEENQQIHLESQINNQQTVAVTTSNATARSEPIHMQAIVTDHMQDEPAPVHLESRLTPEYLRSTLDCFKPGEEKTLLIMHKEIFISKLQKSEISPVIPRPQMKGRAKRPEGKENAKFPRAVVNQIISMLIPDEICKQLTRDQIPKEILSATRAYVNYRLEEADRISAAMFNSYVTDHIRNLNRDRAQEAERRKNREATGTQVQRKKRNIVVNVDALPVLVDASNIDFEFLMEGPSTS